jgi:hypothetical protein
VDSPAGLHVPLVEAHGQDAVVLGTKVGSVQVSSVLVGEDLRVCSFAEGSKAEKAVQVHGSGPWLRCAEPKSLAVCKEVDM